LETKSGIFKEILQGIGIILAFAIIIFFFVLNFLFRVQKLWLKIEEKLTCCQLGGSTKTGIEEKTMVFQCFYVFSFYKV